MELKTVSNELKTNIGQKMKNQKLSLKNNKISIISFENEDYLSLTDMARNQLQEVVIIKWLSLKSTIEYIGEWEALYNLAFNYTELGTIKNTASSNNFVSLSN